MKIFCCYTPAFEGLYKECFLPSVPEAFSVAATEIEIAGSGDFMSPEFVKSISRKIDLILESLEANRGEVVIWADVDIQFFDLRPAGVLEELGDCDIVFQHEGRNTADVNTGFFACRCNEAVRAFFGRVRDVFHSGPRTNEQGVINKLLQEEAHGLRWGYFSFRYYARTHGWPPPRGMALYHANYTIGPHGVERKMAQFREVAFLRRFGFAALVFTSIKYAPRRVIRLATEWFSRRRR